MYIVKVFSIANSASQEPSYVYPTCNVVGIYETLNDALKFNHPSISAFLDGDSKTIIRCDLNQFLFDSNGSVDFRVLSNNVGFADKLGNIFSRNVAVLYQVGFGEFQRKSEFGIYKRISH